MSSPQHSNDHQSSMDVNARFSRGFMTNSSPNWYHLRKEVRSSRKFQAQLANKIPHNFTFIPRVTDGSECNESKLLFLGVLPDFGVLPGFKENTLLYVDVQSTQSPHLLDKPVKWKQAMQFFQGTPEKYSKEEELLRERKRLSVHGITTYQISSDYSRILFPAAGTLFIMDINSIGMVDMKYCIRTGAYELVDTWGYTNHGHSPSQHAASHNNYYSHHFMPWFLDVGLL